MREIQLRWGRRNLGFAWLFLEPLIFALPVLTFWSFMDTEYRGGIPLWRLLARILPILMFRHVTSHFLYAIRSGGGLFYHRDITPFDVVIARIGLEVMGNFAATAVSFYLFYMIGVIEWPQNPSLFLLGFLHGLVVGFRSYNRRCLERAERHCGTYLDAHIIHIHAGFRLLLSCSMASKSRCASLR